MQLIERKIVIVLTSILFLGSETAMSFEIKPLCPPPSRGAYCESASTEDIVFRISSDECERTGLHVITGQNQPIHEAITRQAYLIAFNKRLKNYNFLQPLISGVEWNDDPEQLARKLIYDNGLNSISQFNNRITSRQPEKSMTVRSHFGDMQFLHAMRGSAASNTKEVKLQLYEWIKHTYKVAVGEIAHDQKISETFFHNYFKTKDMLVIDIFDPRRMFWNKEFSTKRIASGSILHILQDSYSASHVKRNSETWEIEKFHTYPNEYHCISDVGSEKNRKNIEKAIAVSAKYMELKDKNVEWCSGMAPFIAQVLDLNSFVEDDCGLIENPQ